MIYDYVRNRQNFESGSVYMGEWVNGKAEGKGLYELFQSDFNLMYIGLILYEYIIQNVVSYT